MQVAWQNNGRPVPSSGYLQYGFKIGCVHRFSTAALPVACVLQLQEYKGVQLHFKALNVQRTTCVEKQHCAT